jgi:Coenzyme A transferase
MSGSGLAPSVASTTIATSMPQEMCWPRDSRWLPVERLQDLSGRKPNLASLDEAGRLPRERENPLAFSHGEDVNHAQRADRQGNIFLEGIVGVQKEAALAATRVIVTVEEIVDDLRIPSPNAVVLPCWTISAVVEVPGGARPSYTHGYYRRDNAFYTAWDAIARNRERFLAWMQEHVLSSQTGSKRDKQSQ